MHFNFAVFSGWLGFQQSLNQQFSNEFIFASLIFQNLEKQLFLFSAYPVNCKSQRIFIFIHTFSYNFIPLCFMDRKSITTILILFAIFLPAQSTFGLLGGLFGGGLFGNFWNLFSHKWGIPSYQIPQNAQLIPNFNRNQPISTNNIRTNSDDINIQNSQITINQPGPGFLSNRNDLPITYIPSNALPFSTINNYLTNGDFEVSRIPQNRMIYVTNNIPSWVVNNGELGRGEYFNVNWAPQTQLIHLNSNLGYLNKVNLRPGRYQLSFDWAARDGQVYDTSKFLLKLNNKLLKTINPWNYYCHRYSTIIDSIDGWNDIQIVGSGILDNYGASIDNVVLRDYQGH